MLNSLTLKILSWYKQRFKDIVQGFETLIKWLKKMKWNEMNCRIRKVKKNEKI